MPIKISNMSKSRCHIFKIKDHMKTVAMAIPSSIAMYTVVPATKWINSHF